MEELFTNITVSQYLTWLIIALFVGTAMVLYRVANRDVHRSNSPVYIDWLYFFRTTGARILSTVMLIMATVLLIQFLPAQVPAIIWAMLCGLISDQIPALANKIKGKALKAVKDKIKNR